MIQYDKRNLKYLKNSQKTYDAEVKYRKDKKSSRLGPPSLKIMNFNPLTVLKLEEPQKEIQNKDDEEENENFNEGQ